MIQIINLFSGFIQSLNQAYQDINAVTLYIKGIPPIIFTLFIGPWSDRFGRKILMVLPLFGYLSYNLWFLINAIFFHQMGPEWLMLEIFQYWPGGYMCLFLGTYSYISDQSSKEYRTLRIGIVDFIFYGGITIGYGKFWFDTNHKISFNLLTECNSNSSIGWIYQPEVGLCGYVEFWSSVSVIGNTVWDIFHQRGKG